MGMGVQSVKVQTGTWWLIVLFVSISGSLANADIRIIQEQEHLQHSRPSVSALAKTHVHVHVDSSAQESQNDLVPLHPSSSNVHKIIHLQLNDTHLTSKIGASNPNLLKIIHRLKHYTRSHNLQFYNTPKNPNPNKPTGNYYIRPTKISVNLPSFIRNNTINTRLKRQLEGIFHDKGSTTPTTTTTTTTDTSTWIPIIPSRIPLTTSLPRRIIQDGNAGQRTFSSGSGGGRGGGFATIKSLGGGRDEKGETTEKEISNSYTNKFKFTPRRKDRKMPSVSNFFNTRKLLGNKDKNTNTNADKELNTNTISIPDLHENENGNGKRNYSVEIVEIQRKTVINSDNNNNEQQPPTLLKPVGYFSSKKIQAQTPLTGGDYDKFSQTDIHKIQQNPLSIEEILPGKQIRIQKPDVNFQEQIPYNGADVDHADLKDYLDGYSTFGAKGDNKHTVKNIGSDPNYNPTNSQGQGLRKRTPQSNQPLAPVLVPSVQLQYRPRSRAAIENIVAIEDENMKLKQRNNNPQKRIFTPTGNRDKADNLFPTVPKSTLDELYRQGHPAIAKPPKPILQNHPYAKNLDEYQENPFRANPLFDDRDGRLAQSNIPAPVQVENTETTGNKKPSIEYQDKSPPPKPTQNRNKNNGYNGDDHDFDEYGSKNDREQENDGFIRDFVSLDDNFQQLPRPSAEDESFRSLVPEEADDSDSPYYEPDDRSDRAGRRSQERDGDEDDVASRPSHDDDDYSNSDNSDDDDNDNPEEFASGPNRGDFDAAYHDALKAFDEEIKKIQDSEREVTGTTTGNPPTSRNTGEPILLTSPRSSIPYTRNIAQDPRPTQATTFVQTHRPSSDDESEEDEEDERRPQQQEREEEDDRNTTTEKTDDEEESDEPTPTPASKEEMEDPKVKDADESIKVVNVNKITEKRVNRKL